LAVQQPGIDMKIAILGTRGIPNNYGGFEQITEWLSAGLAEKNHDVTVYNSHNHPYKQFKWKNVHIVHCFDPEYLLRTAGQFVYDLNCIRDARNRNFDVILFMGYTSSSIWSVFFPKKPVIISNMDGFEWKRTKYAKHVRLFLQFAERLAVKSSDQHIADSTVMKDYLQKKYKITSHYIPYGPSCTEPAVFNENEYGLEASMYYLLLARMESENNVEMILDGFVQSGSEKKFLVVGNTKTPLGKRMEKKYSGSRVLFAGGIFNPSIVESLRRNAFMYFHGHSVGGTNPSLLEAMNSRVLIAAHRNPFNEAVLGEDSLYFSSPGEVRTIIENGFNYDKERMIRNNVEKLAKEFNREKVIAKYEALITTCRKK
jgi:glycosyltransferase involved in cell wall biosynthesis